MPTGPVTTAEPMVGVLLAPMTKPPAVTLTPPGKALAPLSWSKPFPAFVSVPVLLVPIPWSTAEILSVGAVGEMFCPLMIAGATTMLTVLAPDALSWLPKSIAVPLIVGSEAGLLDCA